MSTLKKRMEQPSVKITTSPLVGDGMMVTDIKVNGESGTMTPEYAQMSQSNNSTNTKLDS